MLFDSPGKGGVALPQIQGVSPDVFAEVQGDSANAVQVFPFAKPQGLLVHGSDRSDELRQIMVAHPVE